MLLPTTVIIIGYSKAVPHLAKIHIAAKMNDVAYDGSSSHDHQGLPASALDWILVYSLKAYSVLESSWRRESDR
jgi:hypothetical protein